MLSRQWLIFTYHKSGTVLFEHCMGRVAALLGLRIATRFGHVAALEPGMDAVVLAHGMLDTMPDWPYRAVRIVRDPRDLWVSGYLYHRHCREAWCINADFEDAEPIGVPQVDYAMQHRPEAWKREYLARLNGQSYQQNLLTRDTEAGLAFELAGYTGVTLEAMAAWPHRPEVLDVQLEQIAASFDDTMRRVFTHLGLDPAACEAAVACCADEDVARMPEAQIAGNPHIHGRALSKWRQMLSPSQIAAFEAVHGGLIQALGYALAAQPRPRPPVGSEPDRSFAMTDGPTTMNGPLHTDDATLDDRAIVATFATPADAHAAQAALVQAGIDAGRISITEHAAQSPDAQAAAQPADPGILGRLREAILPEDSEQATRAAVRNDDAVLTLRPLPQEVEAAVQIIQAAKPTRFDADLERWRNAT